MKIGINWDIGGDLGAGRLEFEVPGELIRGDFLARLF
jgi:hypothetical protein